MNDFKISIVMPVYNTNPKYLEQAVDSVLNQSYENFELIIVDDGSTSECALQCDNIKDTDPRIAVIHQKNSGVSTARNHGTESAGGEYVMYMDSDDLLAKNALKEGIDAINATGAQFVFAGLQHISDYSKFRGDEFNTPLTYRKFEKNEIDFVIRSFFTQRNRDFSDINGIGAVNRGPCARLIKTDIAKAIKFEGRLVIGEDVEWNMRILNACDTVCFVKSIWYGYLVYSESSLRKYYGNRAELLEDYHTLLYERNREFCEKDPIPYAVNMAVSFYFMAICEYLSEKCPLSGSEKRKELKKILNRDPWTILKKKDINSKLPARYRVFIAACRLGLGLEMLKTWEGIKKWKKRLG